MDRYERLNRQHAAATKTLRVGAYGRVSTDKEDQANSFDSQLSYFKSYIERHADWEFVEVFADEGVTGTSTKKRKAFNRMIACAMNGELDLIITKEISRFARNTLDSIYYTRELKKRGVGVVFLNDNINTLDADAELRLTIMSSIAQEESRKTSERVKWGQKRRMEQGVVFGRDMLGYDVRGGKLYINEHGAKIVRLIFDKFVNEHKGCHTIARELSESGYTTVTGKLVWTNTVIYKILRNEKYCGDLVQKKTITVDYLTHDKKYNRGEEEFVILRNHHEPIVSHELFDAANLLLDNNSNSRQDRAKYSNRYCFSGKIKCGKCGCSYRARTTERKSGSVYKTWRCRCPSDSIRNDDALHIMRMVIDSLVLNKEAIISSLVITIQSVVPEKEKMADIASAIKRISASNMYEEDFYRNLLDRIIVHSKDNLDVHLKALTHTWSYTMAPIGATRHFHNRCRY